MISSETVTTDRMVLEHYFDHDTGNYRLIIGQKIIKHYVSIPGLTDPEGHPLDAEGKVIVDDDGEPVAEAPPDELPTDEVIEVINIQDFMFAGDDERWFDEPGVRKLDEEVAELQKQLVKGALAATPDDALNVSAPHVLPGVGGLL